MKRLLLTLAVLALVLPAASASAATIALDSTRLIGTVDPGSPAGPGYESDRLSMILDWYNLPGDAGAGVHIVPNHPKDYQYWVAADPTNVPDIVPVPGIWEEKNDGAWTGSNGLYSFLLPDTSYLYLMAKFGNQDAYFYIGDLSAGSEVQLVSPFGTTGAGLSHLSYFNEGGNEVPEPASMLLLGTGLFGLAGAARRRFRR